MGTCWKKMMKKHTKSTSCLCSALPRALINSGRQGDEGPFPQTAPSRMRFSLTSVLPFLSQSPAPLHFFFYIPHGIIRLSFLYTLEISISSQSNDIQVLAKSCCGFLEESLVYVCMFQKQLPVFQLLSLSPPRLLRPVPEPLLRPVPEPLLRLQAQVTRLLRTGTRQAFMIHLENTSPPRLSVGKPSSSFLSFRQPSITRKHQMGWIEAILQKVLRDWLPQWSFQLEAERPESSAFSAQFHRLKNYRWLP